MILKIELAVVRPQPEADTHLDEKAKIVKLDSTQAQSVAVSENELKGCYSILLSTTSILLSLLGFSYRMVARLCYEEARNKDNLTDCVNINKERAGWDQR